MRTGLLKPNKETLVAAATLVMLLSPHAFGSNPSLKPRLSKTKIVSLAQRDDEELSLDDEDDLSSAPIPRPRNASRASSHSLSAKIAKPAEKPADQPFHLLLDLSTASSLQKPGDVSRVAENDFVVIPKAQIGKHLKLTAKAIVTQDMAGEQNTTLSNVKFNLALVPLALGQSDFNVSPSVSAKAPTDSIDDKEDSFRGSGALNVRFGYEPKWKWEAKAYYILSGEKNVHEFTLNSDGDPNIQYLATNAVELDLPVTKSVSIMATGAWINGWTYHDFQSQRFDTSEILGWEAITNWTIYVAHGNKGSALKENGRDSNVRLFNENTSVFSLGTSYLF